MTNQVTRYRADLSCGPPCVPTMEPDRTGEWIKASDYWKLQQETERLREALKILHPRAGVWRTPDSVEAERIESAMRCAIEPENTL